jgi:hypothetical protein
MGNWKIECEPDGVNDGVNECGMVIYLTDGQERREVSAVGFVRRNAKNPEVDFEPQLDREIAKAKHVLKVQQELEALTADAAVRM